MINKKSKVQAAITPSLKDSKKYGGAFEYLENFREPALKVNDDKKVRINLSDLSKIPKHKMILLTVKCFDLRKSPPKPNEFDRSWYRLINEDTNQTLDYKILKTVEKPEGFDEDAQAAASEEGEAPPPRVDLTYIAGRIYFDGSRWVYEQLNHAFTSDKVPNIVEKLGEIYRTGEEDLERQRRELESIKQKLIDMHEERRQAAIAAAAKRKAGKKGKKEDNKEEEEPPREELQGILREKPHREYDLFNPTDYVEVLKEKIPRPFIFGPIDFYDLTEEPFPVDHWYEEILSTLMNCPYLPPDNILIHGFNLTAKGKTLKRGSTLLKHSRFLKNL